MRAAVCPGSFDPVTNGHLDVFARASEMADEVIVAVLINKTKSSLFTVEERIEMLEETVAPLGNVRIDAFHGLLVDYCRDHGIKAIVKGLRAQMYEELAPEAAEVEGEFFEEGPSGDFYDDRR